MWMVEGEDDDDAVEAESRGMCTGVGGWGF